MSSLKLLITLLVGFFIFSGLQAQQIILQQQGRNCSLRGLSVVNNQVAWVSGSKGTVAITKDGGKTWSWQQVKGFEQADFRDVEAFSAREAILMSSGTPALILKTTDGGANWQVVYRNHDKTYFLDAMDFTPDGKHGYVLGDPIDGKFLLLETQDRGITWAKAAHLPDALPSEAAFAASGTCLRLGHNRVISIVTGGNVSRLLLLYPSASEWQAWPLPLAQGIASKGAFSITDNLAIIVGGDYVHNTNRDSVYTNFSKTQVWKTNGTSTAGPAGYQSCVEWLQRKKYLATGTPGSNYTADGGVTWKQIDSGSFNVCRKAKRGKLVLLAGDQGRIGVFND